MFVFDGQVITLNDLHNYAGSDWHAFCIWLLLIRFRSNFENEYETYMIMLSMTPPPP